jgi:hypothetical protein
MTITRRNLNTLVAPVDLYSGLNTAGRFPNVAGETTYLPREHARHCRKRGTAAPTTLIQGSCGDVLRSLPAYNASFLFTDVQQQLLLHLLVDILVANKAA